MISSQSNINLFLFCFKKVSLGVFAAIDCCERPSVEIYKKVRSLGSADKNSVPVDKRIRDADHAEYKGK